MNLSISTAAKDRFFSKAVRRVLPCLDKLKEEFSMVDLVNPVYEAILVGITDSETKEYFQIIPNRDGFFQVLAGVEFPASDEALRTSVFSVVAKAVRACPFSETDARSFDNLLNSHGVKILNSSLHTEPQAVR